MGAAGQANTGTPVSVGRATQSIDNLAGACKEDLPVFPKFPETTLRDVRAGRARLRNGRGRGGGAGGAADEQPSPGRRPAVDADGLAGDERRLVAGEVQDRVADLLRHAPASHRDAAEIGVLLRLRILLVALDGDPA